MKSEMLFGNDSPHPAHETWGDEIGCRYRHFETNRPPGDATDIESTPQRVATGLKHRDADLVIAEGTAPLQTGLVAKAAGAKMLVYICADQTFMTLKDRVTEPLWELMPELVDGAVAVSYLAWSWAAPYLESPVEVVRPPISDNKHEALREVTPGSGDGPIVSIGKARATKRFDRLPAIAEQTNREIVVVGPGHEDKPYTDSDLVSTPGWLDIGEFADLLERAALYVQPSSGDACPVASMEAMLSGTPTIVSSRTGTRELGAQPIPTLVFPEAIKSALDQPPSDDACETLRDNVIIYTEKNQARRFKRVINKWT